MRKKMATAFDEGQEIDRLMKAAGFIRFEPRQTVEHQCSNRAEYYGHALRLAIITQNEFEAFKRQAGGNWHHAYND